MEQLGRARGIVVVALHPKAVWVDVSTRGPHPRIASLAQSVQKPRYWDGVGVRVLVAIEERMKGIYMTLTLGLTFARAPCPQMAALSWCGWPPR